MKRFILAITALCMPLAYANAQEVKYEWMEQLTSQQPVTGAAIAVDYEENVYMVGTLEGDMTFQTTTGPVQISAIPKRLGWGEDSYILKLNKEGDMIWVKHLGGKGRVQATSVAVDSQMNVYLTGRYKDSVDFDPGAGQDIRATTYYEQGNPGEDEFIQDYRENTFILKLNSDGDYVWARDFHGIENVAYGIATSGSGTAAAVYVAGGYRDTIDVNQRTGNEVLRTGAEAFNVFVVKLTTEGDFVWARQMGRHDRSDMAHGLHVDNQGNVLTTGSFSDSADFDPGAGVALLRSNSAPAANVFISKLDSEGRFVAAAGVGGTTTSRGSIGNAITSDRFGNVIVTGYYQISGDFDPLRASAASRVTGNGNLSCFVAAYDPQLRFKWVRALTSSLYGVEQGRSVAVDDVGSVYTTGHFTSDINFSPNNNPPQVATTPKVNVSNTFISKLDSSGNYNWGKTFRGTFNMGFAIKVTPERHVYVAGHFIDTVDFNTEGTGDIRISGNKRADAFLVKLSCSEQDSSTVVVNVCDASYEFNGKLYTTSGLYEQFFFNQDWCDSLVTLDLTLNEVPDPRINVQGNELSTAAVYATYQWFYEGDTIHGATNQTYYVEENGKYTVAVTNDAGCSGISDYYEVSNVGVGKLAGQDAGIHVYPNPVTDKLYTSGVADLAVFSMDGRMLINREHVSVLDVSGLPAGVYLLRISDPASGALLGTTRFVKDNSRD